MQKSQVYLTEAGRQLANNIKTTTYPDELSDNELFEQENRLQATLLSVESIKEFIVGQQQENTASEPRRKQRETYDKSWEEVEITREIANMPCVYKNKLLCCLYISVL